MQASDVSVSHCPCGQMNEQHALFIHLAVRVARTWFWTCSLTIWKWWDIEIDALLIEINYFDWCDCIIVLLKTNKDSNQSCWQQQPRVGDLSLNRITAQNFVEMSVSGDKDLLRSHPQSKDQTHQMRESFVVVRVVLIRKDWQCPTL